MKFINIKLFYDQIFISMWMTDMYHESLHYKSFPLPQVSNENQMGRKLEVFCEKLVWITSLFV